jgi:S1-C subfamily serine protease
VVERVVQLSPASTAGLGPGDVITAVDNVRVESMAALMIVLATHNAGEKVVLTVRRGTEQRTVVAVLVERPAVPPS